MFSDAEIRAGGLLCQHLLESPDDYAIYYQFTGQDIAYNLICQHCKYVLETLPAQLRRPTLEQFMALDANGEGAVGQPQIRQRPSDLHFVHQVIKLKTPLPAPLLDIQPVGETAWLALLRSGELVEIDLSAGSTRSMMRLATVDLDLPASCALHVSPDGRFAAVVNNRELNGVVLDLHEQRLAMLLMRGLYGHAIHSNFSIGFFEMDGKPHLIHATDWNRLDITDLTTGDLITSRPNVPRTRSPKVPEHYLDYFHGRLALSPDTTWIADYGWMWAPVGEIRVWNLKHWLQHNVWESEDGVSLHRLAYRHYFWDGPLCWLDDYTLAVWGFGEDDEWLIPAVQVFDVMTGKRLRWFAGVRKGLLVFDRYLFAADNDGIDVWDAATGERLLSDPQSAPRWYHPRARRFLNVLEGESFRVSWLQEGV